MIPTSRKNDNCIPQKVVKALFDAFDSGIFPNSLKIVAKTTQL